MAILKLNDNLYISPQLTTNDIEQVVQLGIQTVICNRPDKEEENQPSANQVHQWLLAKNILHFHHQPVVAPTINADDVAQFQILLNNSSQPVLAYCRTGTRSALLWSLHQVQQGLLSPSEAITTAKQAGVDLSNFESRLQAMAQLF